MVYSLVILHVCITMYSFGVNVKYNTIFKESIGINNIDNGFLYVVFFHAAWLKETFMSYVYIVQILFAFFIMLVVIFLMILFAICILGIMGFFVDLIFNLGWIDIVLNS